MKGLLESGKLRFSGQDSTLLHYFSFLSICYSSHGFLRRCPFRPLRAGGPSNRKSTKSIAPLVASCRFWVFEYTFSAISTWRNSINASRRYFFSGPVVSIVSLHGVMKRSARTRTTTKEASPASALVLRSASGAQQKASSLSPLVIPPQREAAEITTALAPVWGQCQ